MLVEFFFIHTSIHIHIYIWEVSISNENLNITSSRVSLYNGSYKIHRTKGENKTKLFNATNG